MLGDARVVGLIPARGGSKGLPGKNVATLAGKPLIAWTVEAALASRYVDDVVVSTDDTAIAQAAADAGAQVPFMRPAELATDGSRMVDVVLHALDALAAEGRAADILVLLQPTSPLRGSADVDGALELLRERDVEAVVSVCEAEHSLLFANTLPPDRGMGGFLRPEFDTANRQQLPTYYRLNGAVYVSRVDAFRRRLTFVHDGAVAYIMPNERSVDVDGALDLALAEVLMALRGPRPGAPGSGG